MNFPENKNKYISSLSVSFCLQFLKQLGSDRYRLSNIPEYQIVPILTYTILLRTFNINGHHFTANIQLSNAMVLFKILLLALRECCVSQLFSFHHKKPSFFNFLRSSHGFSFRLHGCKPLYTTPCTSAIILDVSMSVVYKRPSNIHVMS